MHAAQALRGHQRVLHAARLVLRHRLDADEHYEQQHAEGVAVHLGGVVLAEDDFWRDKAGGAHHATAVRLLAQVQDHTKVDEFYDLQQLDS